MLVFVHINTHSHTNTHRISSVSDDEPLRTTNPIRQPSVSHNASSSPGSELIREGGEGEEEKAEEEKEERER